MARWALAMLLHNCDGSYWADRETLVPSTELCIAIGLLVCGSWCSKAYRVVHVALRMAARRACRTGAPSTRSGKCAGRALVLWSNALQARQGPWAIISLGSTRAFLCAWISAIGNCAKRTVRNYGYGPDL